MISRPPGFECEELWALLVNVKSSSPAHSQPCCVSGGIPVSWAESEQQSERGDRVLKVPLPAEGGSQTVSI